MTGNKTKKPGKASAIGQFQFSKRLGKAKPASIEAARHNSKIQELQNEIDMLTSFTSDTVYRLNYSNMRYEYISPAVKNLLGYSAEEMQLVQFRSLILETKMVSENLKKIESFAELEGKRCQGDITKWQADYLMSTKDGGEIWVSDVSYPWFDENGKIIGSIGSLRDITSRVHAEARNRAEDEARNSLDKLTGIANRKVFFDELDRELKRINRTDYDISILLIDIDKFKDINDEYGNSVGDVILKEFTKLVATCLREIDIPARIGGAEFAVLLPDTSMQGAYYVAERICSAIIKHEFRFGTDENLVGITASIGVASAFPGADIKSSELYKLADTRLYIAKNTGSNQISIDDVVQLH